MTNQPADRRASRFGRLALVAQGNQAPAEAAPTPQAARAPRSKKIPNDEPQPTAGRGTRPGGPPPGTSWLTAYLPAELFEDMRSAYVWELDNTAEPETSIARWISRAMIRHARRTKAERLALAEAMPEAEVPGLTGHMRRAYTITDEAISALDDAVTADRKTGDVGTLTAAVTVAVWADVEAARTAAGGHLAPVTGRLPSKPRRAEARR